MEIKETKQGKYKVFDLIDGEIVANAGIKFGEPTIKNTRIPTYIASGAYLNKGWDDYGITERQAFIAYCFEQGIEYWKKHLKIRKVIIENQKEIYKQTRI